MKTQKKSAQPAKQAKGLSKKDQKSTNGGSVLGGGDDSMSNLSSSLGFKLHSDNTDEDGQTSSNNFGGGLGSSTSSINNND